MSDLAQAYRERYERLLVPVARQLEEFIKSCLAGEPRIDRITARAKSVSSFLEKASRLEKGALKYTDPLKQIQDQIGARIITFYTDDVPRVSAAAETYLRHVEARDITPESEYSFGYFGRHYVMFLPNDVLIEPRSELPTLFELQVKTLFQHAWSEANHDLGYKPECELNAEQHRRLAFTAAQAWGADLIFSELHQQAAAAAAQLPDGVSGGN
jgi:putative GTP pyrophosphokinase